MNYSDIMAEARLKTATMKLAKSCKRQAKQARQATKLRDAQFKLANKVEKRKNLLAKQLENKQSQKHPLLVLPRNRTSEIIEFSYVLSGRKNTKNFTSWTSCSQPNSELQLPIYVLAEVKEFMGDENVELKKRNGRRIEGDEYVVLGLAFKATNFKTEVESFDTDSEFEEMKTNMNSQVGTKGKALNHFGSSARGVFSFGKTAKHTLDPVTQSSVSDFSFKVGIDDDVKLRAKEKANSYFQRTLRHLAKGTQAHLTIDGVRLTNSALKELNKRAASAVLNNFLELDLDLQGYAAGHFNFGYNCDVPHSERDSTYTLLHIPTQTTQGEDDAGTWFEWFTEKHAKATITIPMHQGIVVFFSAYSLSHRQQSQGGSLMNLSFYGNKSLVEKGNFSVDRAIVVGLLD
jgi:hypothetical protein